MSVELFAEEPPTLHDSAPAALTIAAALVRRFFAMRFTGTAGAVTRAKSSSSDQSSPLSSLNVPPSLWCDAV